MSESLGWLGEELASLESNSLRRTLRLRQSPHVAGMVQLDGQPLVDFGANDYLGLSADPRLVESVRSAVCQMGWGSGASPLVNGRAVLHQRLESEIARLKQTESALLFTTGFAANVGTLTSLVGKDDVIFSDEKNHASIIDGCRLSRAQTVVYRHSDVEDLHQKLKANVGHGRVLIVTDSVFSMDGDAAPLQEICDLANDYNAMVMVDEAHATGVLGDRGSGLCEACNVEHRVDIRIGTLSKALGSFGGFVAGSRALTDYILNRARSYIFSTAQPEAMAAAGITAIELIKTEPWRRQRVMKVSQDVQDTLRERGWNVGNGNSTILPIIVGEPQKAMKLHQKLLEFGVFAPGIRPPAVPSDQCLVRLSFSASHTDEQIEKLLGAIGNP